MDNLKQNLINSDPFLPKFYKGAKKPVNENRAFLGKFKGGCVELAYLDDIAVVSLDHTEKRNAISGKLIIKPISLIFDQP